MWALIMTVYLDTFSMTTLQGFQTEEACRITGAQQEVALRNDLKINTSKNYTFVCVKGEKMKQSFEDYRAKTIVATKRNKQLKANDVRSWLNDKLHDKDASKDYIENRERLKTDEEFLTFFKQHFGEEL